ncbi:ribonuclease P protein component [uncultured Campylobacter sp.]|uniref:ribonuclease P protein component n=1 Tax=uncultured Campylobacter sp. TaxID=218934 RepID=UPI00262A4DA1|nr:ribonuclease P protein component [uncultured Campylobacter sp.]
MNLTKFEKISKTPEFKFIYQNGTKWHSRVAVVYFLADTKSRFAVVASKKVGKAVIRNRVKRRLKVAFTQIQNELKIGNYIVVARNEAANVEFSQIVGNLRWSFKRLGLL